MKSKTDSLKLGHLHHEDSHYLLYRAEYRQKPAAALKIKEVLQEFQVAKIYHCQEILSLSNHASVLELIGIISRPGSSNNIVIIENFSNTIYELLTKNSLKLSQQNILNHVATFSSDCASLMSEGYFPKLTLGSVGLDSEGAFKIIHPHLIDVLIRLSKATYDDDRMFKVNENMAMLFFPPEAHFEDKIDEAFVVFQFGLILLYSSIGNLDFMNHSYNDCYNISLTTAHPDIPADCHPAIARVITHCLKIAEERPSFAKISDYLLTYQKIEQAKAATKNLQQDKVSLLSRVPKDILNNEVMKAIEAHGLFASSNHILLETFDNSECNTARPK